MQGMNVNCHDCGHDNPAEAFHCADCRVIIPLRAQPSSLAQQFHYKAVNLMQSAQRPEPLSRKGRNAEFPSCMG